MYNKIICVISNIYSFVYGYISLILFNMVNKKVNFTPVFKLPSAFGLVRGLISLVFYILIEVGIGYISKGRINRKEIIVKNKFFLFLGMFAFWLIGAGFYIETPDYG